MEPFTVTEPTGKKVPVLISSPPSGTDIPHELASLYDPEQVNSLDDTDWYVNRLYRDFADELGITMIEARYSRWVIDLNRDPQSQPLYDDGRIITSLCTTTDFFGNAIYAEKRFEPDQQEVERRLVTYYWPYYTRINELLGKLKDDFGTVLFYDAHSIRKHVPTIRQEPFPDLILGSNDEKSADRKLIDIALEELKKSGHEVTHNYPFKGGHLTRYFGKPEEGRHALQLERSKKLYMDDAETEFDEKRAAKLSATLKSMFERLIRELT